MVAGPHAVSGSGALGRVTVREVGGDERIDCWDTGSDNHDVELVAARDS